MAWTEDIKSIVNSIPIEENKTTKQTDKRLIKQSKFDIISLAYSDYLSSDDILELSEILLTISKYKAPNKKRGL